MGSMMVMIGIDIGQKHDPTAIAVLEVEMRPGASGPEDHYLARHLERLPLGTPYPDVVKRLTQLVQNVGARASQAGAESLVLMAFVDATGVGQPVVDMLRAAGVAVRGCYFTHGDKRTTEHGRISIGKAWLVSRLQVLLQTGRLHLPDTAEARALASELQDYEIRVDENANDTYGAFKVGKHDDIVTAIGLAVQHYRYTIVSA